jgi:hypothetical protein
LNRLRFEGKITLTARFVWQHGLMHCHFYDWSQAQHVGAKKIFYVLSALPLV